MTKEMAINILRGAVLGTNEQTHEAVFMAIKALKEQERVDAEPVKHGHWIEVQRIHEKDHTAICECSLCGDTVWIYDGQRAWNYCPNCGAHMEVEDGVERK